MDGAYLSQNLALYLGTDQTAVPAVGTFLHWVQVASPGFDPDLFTAYGWLSADLFVQGLKNAGSNPSRGSLLQALSKITSFNGSGFNAPSDPATKTPPQLLPDRHRDQRTVRSVAGQPADLGEHRRLPV